MLPQYLVYITIPVTLFAEIIYIKDTLSGKTKPNRVSWFIWFLAPVIASIVQFHAGAGISAIPVFMAGVMPLFIFLSSFKNKNAYWKLGVLDYVCFILSFLAILFWVFFKDVVLVTIFAILADGIAFIPTYVKSFREPNTETTSTYHASIFSACLSILTLTTINFVTAGFAFYLLIFNLAEVVLVFFRKKSFQKVN